MFFSFWNWFFECVAPAKPHLENLGTFVPIETNLFLLQPTGRFEIHLQRAIHQNAPPPDIPNRWGGPRNIQSILRFRSLVQAGASIQSGSKLQEIIWQYHKHRNIPIMESATQIHKAILSFGDALILHRKAQLSSFVSAKVCFDQTNLESAKRPVVQSVHLQPVQVLWRVEIKVPHRNS